jgi:predicted metal-binding membrane protein
MTGMNMGPTLVGSVSMMAAMMLPSAMPAITRRARDRDGLLAAPWFAGAYLGIWVLVALAMWLLYRPPGAGAAGLLLVGAGLYELTPLKRACRNRCRERVRSGVRFGVNCLGSSIGLMLVLVAVDVMSIALMVAIAVVALVQKSLAPHSAIDIPLAVAIVATGVAIAAT